MYRNKSKPSLIDLHSSALFTEHSGDLPSPTTSTVSVIPSVSLMAEKIASDLNPMLKNAYHTLKDKERDLKLATEIRKSLLENSIIRKNKYENILHKTRSAPMTTILPTPSSSIVTISQRYESLPGHESYLSNRDSDDNDNDNDNDNNNDDDGNNGDDYTKSMRYIYSQSTQKAMIDVLELKHTELNDHLETILEEHSAFSNISNLTSESVEPIYQQSEFGMESLLACAAGMDQKTLDEAILLVDHLEEVLYNGDHGYATWLLGQEGKGNDSFSLVGDDGDDVKSGKDSPLWTIFDSGLSCNRLYPDASIRSSAAKENDFMVDDSTTFSGRIENTIRFFFKAVWRWCRFAAILTTAFLITVWNGPDSMLL